MCGDVWNDASIHLSPSILEFVNILDYTCDGRFNVNQESLSLSVTTLSRYHIPNPTPRVSNVTVSSGN